MNGDVCNSPEVIRHIKEVSAQTEHMQADQHHAYKEALNLRSVSQSEWLTLTGVIEFVDTIIIFAEIDWTVFSVKRGASTF